MPKKAKAKASPPPAAAVPAAAPSKTQEEEEKALLEKQWKEQREANTKKAEQAQKSQLRANERQQQWEKEQQRKQIESAREEKKWTKELGKTKVRAKSEGVLESEDWGDGTWWIKIGDMYKEVKDEYYCPHCEKHLNSGTLEAHLNSDLHRKRLAWIRPEAGAAGAAGAAASSPTASTPVCPPARASQNNSGLWQASFKIEPWMEKSSDGWLRCVLCNKVVDDNHLAKDDHLNRLSRWQEEQNAKKFGRPLKAAPDLPYLAYVPWDESDPSSERNLKCLLCNKWVQDATSHSGTHQAPAGAKDHMKYLRNYGPGDCWYEQHVVQVRKKWHPDAPPVAPTVSVRRAVLPVGEVVEA